MASGLPGAHQRGRLALIPALAPENGLRSVLGRPDPLNEIAVGITNDRQLRLASQ